MYPTPIIVRGVFFFVPIPCNYSQCRPMTPKPQNASTQPATNRHVEYRSKEKEMPKGPRQLRERVLAVGPRSTISSEACERAVLGGFRSSSAPFDTLILLLPSVQDVLFPPRI